jgi:hypothetical protein
VDRACAACGGGAEVHTWFWWGNMPEIDYMEDLGLDWVVIIKCNKVVLIEVVWGVD